MSMMFLPVFVVCMGVNGDCLGVNLHPARSHAECVASLHAGLPGVLTQFGGWLHSLECRPVATSYASIQ
jgi:hypothetical protein